MLVSVIVLAGQTNLKRQWHSSWGLRADPHRMSPCGMCVACCFQTNLVTSRVLGGGPLGAVELTLAYVGSSPVRRGHSKRLEVKVVGHLCAAVGAGRGRAISP